MFVALVLTWLKGCSRLFIWAALEESGQEPQFKTPNEVSCVLGGPQLQRFRCHILKCDYLSLISGSFGKYLVILSLACDDT